MLLKQKKSSKLISLELIRFVNLLWFRNPELSQNEKDCREFRDPEENPGHKIGKSGIRYGDWAFKFLKWGFGTWTQNSKSQDSGLGHK